MLEGQGQDAQSDDKAAPPKPMANLRAACQHVYDKYLSKPYSNDPPFNKNQWDREFKGDNDEVVFRPNHGLAHTLRVAAYAPVVAEYFKKFSPEKEKYDFSADQLEKIQIALLFAVVGRKNEWGFSDNKVEYMKFREDCVTAFKDWCKENPGKFTDEEIEQYGKSVLNFGADDMKDPISMMMKACHKLDLLRCFQDDRTESAMSHIAHEIGEDNVKELLLYADQCIRATGDRIMDGHMLGTGRKNYDPTVFPRASKDPNVCLDLFAQVTPPKPQIKIENKSEPQAVSWKPTANDTLVQNILAQQKPSQAQPAKTEPLSARDYKTIAASLMSEVNAKQVLTDMSALMNKNDISLSDKGKLLHNSGLLLVRLLAAETPPESFKDLVNYLSAPDDQKKNFEDKPSVAAYKGLVDAAKQHPELNGILKDFENKNVEFAKAVKKNEQTFDASKDALRGTGPSVDIDGFINDKLAKEKVKPAQMEKYAEQLAQALKAQNIEALLNVQMKDLYEGQWSKPGKGESAANLNIVLQQTAKIVRDDVLNGKSKEHQIALIDFYAQVMQKSFQNKDYSTAYALYVAFNDSDVTRLPHIADHMAKDKKFKALYNEMHHTFDAQGNMKNYRALLAEQHGNVIPIFSILLKDMEFASQVAKVDSQNKTANVGQFEVAAKSLDAFSAYRTAALTSKAPESTMDLSHFKRSYMGEKEAYAASKRLQKPEAFDLTAKKDEANAKIQADGLDGIDSINARFGAVNSVLDKDLNLPVNLVVQANGKTFENQKAYPLLIKELQVLANEAIQAKEKAKSPFGKKQCDLVLEKIMINVQAIERHAENHQALKGAQKQLSTLKASLEGAGVKPKTDQELKGEIAKQKFKLGRADSYVKDIKSAAGITEVERVPFGPLAKNEATKQYEDLMKGMLAGKDFTHKTEMIDGVGQLIITMDGKDYNMSKIMKDVNLNHLQFTDAEKQAYVQMMTADGTHHFGPCKPNEQNPKVPISVNGRADIEALDASFLQRDPKLSEISQAERLALNVYSTGFFRDANGFMRGGIPSETNMKKPGFLKELICHTGMAVSGLQGISTEVPIATFRGEKQLPKPVLDARIAAAESGGVTVEAGFVSTSQDKPDADFGFKHEEFDESVAIVYTNLTGKDIHGLSAFPHEREFLIPPTQMQWQAHATAKGGHLFLASPVNTPLGLSPEARKMFTPDVVAAAPNPDPAAVVPPVAPPPPQAADAPPPAAPKAKKGVKFSEQMKESVIPKKGSTEYLPEKKTESVALKDTEKAADQTHIGKFGLEGDQNKPATGESVDSTILEGPSSPTEDMERDMHDAESYLESEAALSDPMFKDQLFAKGKDPIVTISRNQTGGYTASVSYDNINMKMLGGALTINITADQLKQIAKKQRGEAELAPAAPPPLSADLEALAPKANQVAGAVPPPPPGPPPAAVNQGTEQKPPPPPGPPPIPSRENKPPLQPKDEMPKQEGPEKPAISKKPMLKKSKAVYGLPKLKQGADKPPPPPGLPPGVKPPPPQMPHPDVVAKMNQQMRDYTELREQALKNPADKTISDKIEKMEKDNPGILEAYLGAPPSEPAPPPPASVKQNKSLKDEIKERLSDLGKSEPEMGYLSPGASEKRNKDCANILKDLDTIEKMVALMNIPEEQKGKEIENRFKKHLQQVSENQSFDAVIRSSASDLIGSKVQASVAADGPPLDAPLPPVSPEPVIDQAAIDNLGPPPSEPAPPPPVAVDPQAPAISDDLAALAPAAEKAAQKMPEPDKPVAPAVGDAKLQDTITKLGISGKAVNAYEELVQSEEAYLGKLNIVQKKDVEDLAKKYKLPQDVQKDLTALVDKLVEIRQAEKNLLDKLKEPNPLEWKNALDSLQEKYVDYVALQGVMDKVPKEMSQEFSNDPKSQGQLLGAVMMEPVQRGMRFNMLLQELQRRVPDDSPKKGDFVQALAAATDFAAAGNKGRAKADDANSRKMLEGLREDYNKKPSDKALSAYLEALSSSPLGKDELKAEFEKMNFSKISSSQVKILDKFKDHLQAQKVELDGNLKSYEKLRSQNQAIVDDFKQKGRPHKDYEDEEKIAATATNDVKKTQAAIDKNSAITSVTDAAIAKVKADAAEKKKGSVFAKFKGVFKGSEKEPAKPPAPVSTAPQGPDQMTVAERLAKLQKLTTEQAAPADNLPPPVAAQPQNAGPPPVQIVDPQQLPPPPPGPSPQAAAPQAPAVKSGMMPPPPPLVAPPPLASSSPAAQKPPEAPPPAVSAPPKAAPIEGVPEFKAKLMQIVGFGAASPDAKIVKEAKLLLELVDKLKDAGEFKQFKEMVAKGDYEKDIKDLAKPPQPAAQVAPVAAKGVPAMAPPPPLELPKDYVPPAPQPAQQQGAVSFGFQNHKSGYPSFAQQKIEGFMDFKNKLGEIVAMSGPSPKDPMVLQAKSLLEDVKGVKNEDQFKALLDKVAKDDKSAPYIKDLAKDISERKSDAGKRMKA